jgi:hypothetical protein
MNTLLNNVPLDSKSLSVLSEAEQKELIAILEIEAQTQTALTNPFAGPWDYLTRAVYTQDQAAGSVRQFPDLEYLRHVVEARECCKLFAVIKSRRMIISWLMCALYLYETATAANQASFIASRKFETSCELVGRLAFIYDHVPPDVWPNKPAMERRAGQNGRGNASLYFPALSSNVYAVAEGSDQLRQYGASRVLCDEAAFWDRWEDSWSALKPTIQGGGRIDLVTTPESTSPVRQLLYGSGAV